MITRLYADNFRCLVNFELKFDRLNLLMGLNGSGKSSVFDVLRRLQYFISGDCRLQAAFPARELTRWQSSPEQRFELDLDIPEGKLRYVLLLEHMDGGQKSRVREETLTEQGKPLFERRMGEVHLYRDDFNQGPVYPFDWSLPALATVQPSPVNTKLTAFRREMSKLVIAAISPSQMEGDSREEADTLTPRMENFVSWYRRLAQENMGAMFQLFQELGRVLPGFASFSFKDAGEDTKILKVLFDRNGSTKSQLAFDFGDLSDGQRVLIALYTLIHGLKGSGLSLFLDEPDNFVALREVQPWLSTLSDECGESFEQAVLISHHPEIIDYMGGTKGRWFSREASGPVRVQESPPKATDGLSLSETLVRGWES
jgi:ATPase subunit of ABC transporter with duplicated ATPase domains